MFPQEILHPELGLPIVQWSHTFLKINIEKHPNNFELDKQNNGKIVDDHN